MKNQRIKSLFTAGVMTTSLLFSSSAFAADMFLKLDGVKGESTDDKHKGEIEVLAWSWGESVGSARTRRGTLPAVCIQDLSLTKYVDAATPDLIGNTVTGTVANTAVLVVRKSGGRESVEYLKFTLKNVTISSYQTGGSAGETVLTENIVLHFDSLEGQYVPQKADGTAGTPIPFQVSGGNSAGCQ